MIATLIKRYHLFKLQKAQKNPRRVQEQILLRILRDNQDTEFGREHGFATINSLEGFQSQVPIRTSKEYAHYLEKSYQGDHQVLTKKAPYFYAMTAGSTGDYKHIPLTKAFKQELDRSVLCFYHMLELNCPGIKDSPTQFLVGSAEGGVTPGGIPKGFVSGFNYKNLPKFIRDKFIVPYWVFTLENAEDRYYAMARYLIDNGKVSAIAAFSPLNISNIAKAILTRLDTLEEDLKSGALTLENPVPDNTVSFQPKLTLHADVQSWRANAAEPKELMSLLFPNLQYYAAWLGGNMANSARTLFSLMGEKPVFEMPFSASEGIFAIPYKINQQGGIAAITSHFLEYIEEADIENADPKAYLVDELSVGKNYYQIVTTSAGLYRYSMEDLITVVDFWDKTPVVKFISKKARQVSISNERINENDVTEAFLATCKQQDLEIEEFILFPTPKGYYRLMIDIDLDNLQSFADGMEDALCGRAMGYEFEREDLLLESLELCVVEGGGVHSYVHARQVRSTLPSAQFKPVHLAASFDEHEDFIVVKSTRAHNKFSKNNKGV